MFKNKIRKALSLALATTMSFAMTLTGVGSNIGVVNAAESSDGLDSATQVNYSTILGRGVDYGIIAENYQQRDHIQSTFAVKNYSRSSNCDAFATVDLIQQGAAAQILVGNIDMSNPEIMGQATRGPEYLKFDGDVAGAYIVEVGDEKIYEGNNIFFQTKSEKVLRVNPDTASNVEDMYKRVYTYSEDMAGKGLTHGINYRDYYNSNDSRAENKACIDLTAGDFADKVVYINADQELLTTVAENGRLHIIKDPSTVVVFNINDNSGSAKIWDNDGNQVEYSAFIAGYTVSTDGGQTWINPTAYSCHDSEKDSNPETYAENRKNDEQLCQKIIWNIRSTGRVGVQNTSGLFIAPDASIFEVAGTSAGWVVAKNFANTSGEWHYIYHGGDQSVIDNGVGEVNFAVNKRITHQWDGTNTVQDSSVEVPEGAYSFYWYENDASYSITDPSTLDENDVKIVGNNTTSKVHFPKLKFYTNKSEAKKAGEPDHYVEKDDSKTFYYTIREVGAGTADDKGIMRSTGYVNIELTVKNVDGILEFYGKTSTYLGDSKHTLFSTISDKNGDAIRFTDVELLIGDFFNCDGEEVASGADVLISKQAVGGGDELPGATFTLTGKVSEDENAEDILFSEENSSEYTPVVVSNDQKSLNWETGKAPTEIKNLPDGVYTLIETAAPQGYDIASAVTFTIKDGVVTGSENSVIPADDDNPAIVRVFDDLYKTEVTLSKRDYNKRGELAGATLAVARDEKGNDIVKDAKTGEKLQWVSSDTAKKVNLLNGAYFLVELVAPGNYDYAESIEFVVKNGVVIVDGNAVDKVTMFDAELQAPKTDVYISKKIAGSSDELPGATLILTGIVDDAGVKYPVVFNEDNVRRMMDGRLSDDKMSIIWTSEGEETRVSDLLDGYYTLTEKAAPQGYEITSDLYFEIKDGKLVADSVKKEVKGSTPAESGKGEAPEGTLTTGNKGIPVITMFDDAIAPEPAKTDVLISKQEVGGSDELPGATFTLVGKDSEDKEIIFNSDNVLGTGASLKDSDKTITWTTGDKATQIKSLPDGVYTLTETAAPLGYDIASAVTFTIKDGVVTGSENSVIPADDDNPAIVRVFDDLCTTDVDISKKSVSGDDELPGATFKLTGVAADGSTVVFEDKNIENTGAKLGKGNESIEFISGDVPTRIKSLPDGTYTLTETAAPQGFKIASDLIFTIENGKVSSEVTKAVKPANGDNPAVVTVFDDVYKTNVKISKKSLGSGDELPGAELHLTGKDLNGKTIIFNEDNVKDTNASIVYTKDLIFFNSGSEPTEIKNLPDGKYTLTEKAAPYGYEISSNIEFSIENGVVKGVEESVTPAEGTNPAVVTMFDDLYTTDVVISKTAVGGGEELPGATLTLTGETNEVNNSKNIEFNSENVKDSTMLSEDKKTITWTTEKEANELKNLPDGIYTLTETAAPEGYEIASKIVFEIKEGKVVTDSVKFIVVDENGKESESAATEGTYTEENGKTVIRMFDAAKEVEAAKTDVEISKKVLAGGSEELEGATLILSGKTFATETEESKYVEFSAEENGVQASEISADKSVLTWTTGETAKVIKNLPDGHYTLVEYAAPEGYEIASSIIFDIKDGKVVADSVKTEVSGSNPGESGYGTAADGTYTEATDSKPAVITMFDDVKVYKTAVDISKQTVAGDELEGATLTLTGKSGNEDITFTSANIDENKISKDGKTISFVSGKNPTTIYALPDGTYTLHEEAAPTGYVVATNITFTIEKGKVTGTDVTASVDGKNAIITMVDGAEEVTTEEETTEEVTTEEETTEEVTTEEETTEEVTTEEETTEEVTTEEVTTEEVTTEEPTTEEPVVEIPKTDVEISKKVLAGGSEELEGATLILSGKTFATETEESKYVEFSAEENGVQASEISADKSVLTWTTGETAKVIKNLPDGHYTLVEYAAPEGYEIASSIIFDIKDGKVVADSVKTEVSGSNPGESGYGTAADGTYTEATDSKPAVITMFDDVKVYKTAVDISKQTVAGDELEGATLTLTGKSGNEDITFTSANIDENKISKDGKTISFVSGKNPTTIYALPDGTYTLHEEAAPTGYVVATNITFTIEKGKVTGTDVTASVDGKNAIITMVDGAEEVTTEEETTEEVTTEEETTEEVTTEEETTEEVTTEEITTETPVVEEPKTDVKISKQAVGGGKELEGATLTLTGKDESGKAINFTDDNVAGTKATVSDDKQTITFESGDAPTEIKSLPDGTYTLTEKAAPEGYEIASNIIFTIKDGKVVADSVKTEVVDTTTGDSKTGDAPENTLTEATANSSAIITMFDDLKKVEEVTTEEVTTEDVTTEEVTTEEVTTEEPTTEEVTTEEVTTEEVTTEEVTTEEPTTETPVAEESKTNVKISKQAVGGGKELEGATLTLTGKDEAGKTISFTDDNVAGTTATISDDKSTITFVSGDAPTEIKDLADGTYTLTEKAAPEGYEIASSITFTIKDGKVVADSVVTEVSDASAGNAGTQNAPEGKFTEATAQSSAIITMFDAVKTSPTPTKVDQGETQQEKPTEETESKNITTTEENPNTTSSKTDVKEETPTEEKNGTSSKTDVKEEKTTEATTEKATETMTTTEQTTETTTQQKPEEKKPTTEVKEPSTTTTPSPNAPSTPEKDKNTVSTGDSMNVLPVIILLVISLIGIVFLIVRKIKMRYEY